jgi:4-alpha-glucanotransferase
VWRSKIGQTMARADGRDAVEVALEERGEDRGHLWRAFQDAGIAPDDVDAPDIDNAPVDEALAFVAATPAPLVTYPLEDLLALAEQPNLPGSIDEHPNWRRRMARSVDDMFLDDAFADRLLAVDTARKRSAQPNEPTSKSDTP